MNHSTRLLSAACAIVFLAAPMAASAADAAEAQDAAIERDSSATEQTPKEQTRDAEKAAANDAADRLRENTRLDLDIRLIGHSSKTVAATR